MSSGPAGGADGAPGYAPPHDHGSRRWRRRRPLPPGPRAGRPTGRGDGCRQHRRRRPLPRPARVPRSRLRHLHAGRGPEPRHRLGPGRRDLPHHGRHRALRGPHVVPPRRPRPRHPPVPHPARRWRRAPLRGHHPHHRSLERAQPAAADDRRPGRHANHGDRCRLRSRLRPCWAARARHAGMVRERALRTPGGAGALRGRRHCATRSGCARSARGGRDHPDLPEQPGDLHRPDPRGARHPRRARAPARPRRGCEPDHRRAPGEGPRRPAHGAARHRRVVRGRGA